MRLALRIDQTAPVPPFEQLRAQLALQVSTGRLRPGARLPPIRELATDLSLSPGTVSRAYRELEYAGVVVGRGRRGTFVTDEPPIAHDIVERRQRLAEAAAHYAALVGQLGVDDQDALTAVTDALRALARGHSDAR